LFSPCFPSFVPFFLIRFCLFLPSFIPSFLPAFLPACLPALGHYRLGQEKKKAGYLLQRSQGVVIHRYCFYCYNFIYSCSHIASITSITVIDITISILLLLLFFVIVNVIIFMLLLLLLSLGGSTSQAQNEQHGLPRSPLWLVDQSPTKTTTGGPDIGAAQAARVRPAWVDRLHGPTANDETVREGRKKHDFDQSSFNAPPVSP
jgi:hypothetical protein